MTRIAGGERTMDSRSPPTLPVEPWTVREPRLDPERLGQTESLFALSNGHIGLRGNLDEGEPCAEPGTFLSGFYEEHPLPYPEGGYGDPESGQTIINVTSGKLIRLLVDDEPFDVRTGRLVHHERVLDLRAGTLRRSVEWTSPTGRTVRIRSTRLVSFAERATVAIAYEVEPVGDDVRILVQSELATNEVPAEVEGDDPRVAEALDQPLVAQSQARAARGAVLVHRTARSRLSVAAGMDHDIEAPTGYDIENQVTPDSASTMILARLRAGETFRLVKYVAYDWSESATATGLRNRVVAALTAARHIGWDGFLRRQSAYLDDFWDRADVEIDGDPVAQQAIRFVLFHILQAAARAEGQPIAGKALTGTGYNGHTFWDIDGFVVPMLALTTPRAAADALRWRASTLPRARRRAGTLGLRGAVFPWRTVNGDETSAYWPASTAALHINADVARAFEVYRLVTGDGGLERECGLEVLVETARMWESAGHYDAGGGWHLDGVTGPDEYTAVVNDNVFTNLLAARNLRWAAEGCDRHPDLARRFGVDHVEQASWRAAADAVCVPYDVNLGVHPQCEDFTRLREWDFTGATKDPLMQTAAYFQLYRHQVVKQADLVLAMHWCPERFSDEDKARNLDYYERRTVRDSSLSAGTQAVMCAQTGHLELAHDYLHETALVDLRDLHGSVASGLHIASLAGAWSAVVEGFGGLRFPGEIPQLAPALPMGVRRLRFGMCWHGLRLAVEVTHEQVRCTLPGQPGARLRLRLYGEEVEVTGDEPVTRPLRVPVPLLPEPRQPPGHQPLVTGRAVQTRQDRPSPAHSESKQQG